MTACVDDQGTRTVELEQPLPPERLLPRDWAEACLVTRLYDPSSAGPVVAVVRDGALHDITSRSPTVSRLLSMEDPVAAVRSVPSTRSWPLVEVIADSLAQRRQSVHMLAPIDFQVIKAAGVTFAQSMLERVIEERASGDAGAAAELRSELEREVGPELSAIRPGSRAAFALKDILVQKGIWSQYLEVGIGQDPEIFTKAPVLSAVGVGSEIGVLERSTWNNPEPELVLLASPTGRAVGATLGNDVNLRDFEGRSALLLGAAKDNNASCAVGPFIRLFDETYSPGDARKTSVSLVVRASDGATVLESCSEIGQMSRTFDELLAAACGRHHQYPDGFALFTGTPFAPVEDRFRPGDGFTHALGDVVEISAPQLGTLVNTVNHSHRVAPWTFGIYELANNLATRGLLPSH